MMNSIGNANRTLAWALVLLGSVGTVNLFLPIEARLPFGGLLMLLAPTMLAAGAVLLRFTRPARQPATPAPTSRVAGAGLVLMLVGVAPWIYGTRVLGPNQEEMWGMLGTLTFLFLGLPGLAMAVLGALKFMRDRRTRAVAAVLDEHPGIEPPPTRTR